MEKMDRANRTVQEEKDEKAVLQVQVHNYGSTYILALWYKINQI